MSKVSVKYREEDSRDRGILYEEFGVVLFVGDGAVRGEVGKRTDHDDNETNIASLSNLQVSIEQEDQDRSEKPLAKKARRFVRTGGGLFFVIPPGQLDCVEHGRNKDRQW